MEVVMLAKLMLHQARHPKGLGGRIVAFFMNKGNQDVNDFVVQSLDISPSHHVLDLGFGGGLMFSPLLRALTTGKLYGLEISRTMIEQASKKYSKPILEGKLELKEGTVDKMSFVDGQFDRILTVNTVYFWPNVDAGLVEIARVLKPGGLVGIGYRSRGTLVSLGYEKYGVNAVSEDKVESAAKSAGLEIVGTHAKKARFDDRVTVAKKRES